MCVDVSAAPSRGQAAPIVYQLTSSWSLSRSLATCFGLETWRSGSGQGSCRLCLPGLFCDLVLSVNGRVVFLCSTGNFVFSFSLPSFSLYPHCQRAPSGQTLIACRKPLLCTEFPGQSARGRERSLSRLGLSEVGTVFAGHRDPPFVEAAKVGVGAAHTSRSNGARSGRRTRLNFKAPFVNIRIVSTESLKVAWQPSMIGARERGDALRKSRCTAFCEFVYLGECIGAHHSHR